MLWKRSCRLRLCWICTGTFPTHVDWNPISLIGSIRLHSPNERLGDWMESRDDWDGATGPHPHERIYSLGRGGWHPRVRGEPNQAVGGTQRMEGEGNGRDKSNGTVLACTNGVVKGMDGYKRGWLRMCGAGESGRDLDSTTTGTIETNAHPQENHFVMHRLLKTISYVENAV